MNGLQGIPENEVAQNVDQLIAARNTRIVCQKLDDGTWEIDASTGSARDQDDGAGRKQQ